MGHELGFRLRCSRTTLSMIPMNTTLTNLSFLRMTMTAHLATSTLWAEGFLMLTSVDLEFKWLNLERPESSRTTVLAGWT